MRGTASEHVDHSTQAVQDRVPPRAGLSLVDVLLQQRTLDPELARAVEVLHQLLLHDHEEGRPFLTVMLRTQGKRIEPLKDALLCLSAQTVEDFEVVVIDHDSDPEGADAVRRAVESQPASFRSRIRVLEVKGGTRSRPLNAGLRVSNGRFIAVFDDDDLLFGNWVERFRDAAGDGGDRLLRAQTATQRVKPERWGQRAGFRTLSSAAAEYPRTFDQLDHLLVNRSPFMSIAFPRTLFSRVGLEFDEALEVCEDWDLILRGSLLLGVDDVPAITSIYRRWEQGESSYTRHSREAWLESEKRVVDRVDSSVVLLPSGSVSRIRAMLAVEDEDIRGKLADATRELQSMVKSRSWRWTGAMRRVRRRIEHYPRVLIRRLRRPRAARTDSHTAT